MHRILNFIKRHKRHLLIAVVSVGLMLMLYYVSFWVAILSTDVYLHGNSNSKLEQRLKDVVAKHRYSVGDVSVYVCDMTAGANKFIFGLNYDRPLIPASCQKLLTAFAAYTTLTDTYRTFNDSLFIQGHVSNGVLRGNVYLKTGFDPVLTDFSEFTAALRRKGISTIKGDFRIRLLVDRPIIDDDMPDVPVLYRGEEEVKKALLADLASADITLNGSVLTERGQSFSASNLRHVFSVRRSLDEVIAPMMLESKNTHAEAFVYMLSSFDGHKDDLDYGANYIRAALQNSARHLSYHFNDESYRVVDGSGLSPDNRTSARLLVNILRYSHNDRSVRNLLYNKSLPIAGDSSGTLKARMKNTKAEGNVRAKTGTMCSNAKVSSLAGYCTAANGHRLCFAIICNDLRFSMTRGDNYVRRCRKFQDEFCIELCR